MGLSQSGLAELAGVSPELVSRIERGRCLPSLPTLVNFANVLRTTPNDLLGFEQPLPDDELHPLLDAVKALGSAQRAEIRRIAEALAKYRASPDEDGRAPREGGLGKAVGAKRDEDTSDPGR